MGHLGNGDFLGVVGHCRTKARTLATRAMPRVLQMAIHRQRHAQEASRDDRLWRLVLSEAAEFSRSEGGSADVFRREVVPFIKRSVRCRKRFELYNGAHQFVLEAFLPRYRERLYDYYREQQYHMFVIMLSYPRSGLGTNYVEPYQLARRLLPELRVLDYGTGIPYGLVHALVEDSSAVSAATLVDLDLVHCRFAEFLLRRLAPDLKLVVHRLRNADEMPQLGETFTFLFAKDIWEHLRDPQLVLEYVLGFADEDCLCVLDITHHGAEVHQHITPDVGFIVQALTDAGFGHVADVGIMSGFARGAPLRVYAELTADSLR